MWELLRYLSSVSCRQIGPHGGRQETWRIYREQRTEQYSPIPIDHRYDVCCASIAEARVKGKCTVLPLVCRDLNAYNCNDVLSSPCASTDGQVLNFIRRKECMFGGKR